jgi:hypothetical protein
VIKFDIVPDEMNITQQGSNILVTLPPAMSTADLLDANGYLYFKIIYIIIYTI